MRSGVLFAVLAGALGGLSCGPSMSSERAATPVQTSEDAIIGGTVALGDPAVVALAVRYGPGFETFCTGTLVAPKTVVTAAHCINAYGANLSYYVIFGTYDNQPTKAVQIAAQYANPNYNRQTFDFGIVRLGQPVLDVAPIPMNDQPMSSADVGRPVRHVGWGITSPNSSTSGTKREVSYNVRRVAQYTFESGVAGKQTCQGDSGGPAFMIPPGSSTEVLVGVVSYGDQDCAYEGWDGRLDVVMPWVRQTMAQWEQPTCAPDGACVQGCTPVDQDCVCATDGVCSAECLDPARDSDCPRDCAQNGVCAAQTCGRPDPDCVPEGGLCSAAAQCKERLCINDEQNKAPYCSKACATTADCPDPMVCSVGTCLFPQKPVRQFLDSCVQGADFCAEGTCTGPVGGITRCVKTCITTGDCPGGATCEAGADSRRFCRPADVRFTNVVLPAKSLVSGPAASCSSTGGLPLAFGLVTLLRRRRRAS